jgi:hypothetical protein
MDNQIIIPNLHIIVQAGGRGSRLRHHTWNKPKCLTSIRGKTILYQLFDRFPTAQFHVIGDYAYDMLEKYFQINPPGNNINYTLYKTDDHGTLAGIRSIVTKLNPLDEILLVWSDIILGEDPNWNKSTLPAVYVTSSFVCRYSVTDDKKMKEIFHPTSGVMGMYHFPNASFLLDIPASGDFTDDWFVPNITNFVTIECNNAQEIGDDTSVEIENDRAGFGRFYNKIIINDTTVEKQACDPNYENLIENEKNWYKQVTQLGFAHIPKVISTTPLVLERINGRHAHEMLDLTDRQRHTLLYNHLSMLISLHTLGNIPSVPQEVADVYITKTKNRVESVSKIIPYFNEEIITINGKKCRNIFSERYKDLFDVILKETMPTYFTPIHGDPTFSNTLVDDNLNPWFIDPRGYFSKLGVWGDPNYDFAKVYLSVGGSFDLFNRRKFKLHFNDIAADILLAPSGFDDTIFQEFFGKEFTKIKIIHSLVWLSLGGSTKDDIDSIVASFYLGLYHLEEGLKNL